MTGAIAIAKWILFPALILGVLSCSKKSNNSNDRQDLGSQFAAQIKALAISNSHAIVSEDGSPINNAQILIGTALDTPFKGNLLNSGTTGQFADPVGWTTPQAVTISAPGYIRVTYFSQTPNGQSFTLKKVSGRGVYELTGQTTGIRPVEHGTADYAIVLPALQKTDLFHFSMDMIISPQNDVITIYGQKIKLPSNLTLPTQDQSYFLLPFTLSKPDYRNYFSTSGTQKVLALHGQFPFHKVVDKIRAKTPFYQVINDMTIVGGGLADVNVYGKTQSADIDATSLSFTGHRTIQNENIGAGQFLLGVALAQMQGYLVPTDIKNLAAGSQNSLLTDSNSTMQVLSILKRESEMKGGSGGDRISAVIVPFKDGVAPQHLALLDDPKVATLTHLEIDRPQVPAHLVALGTYASLQSVAIESNRGRNTKVATQVWEVYAPDWLGAIQMPTWPGESKSRAGSMRWSIAFVAGPHKASVDLGPGVMQSVTHVTNVSEDF
jgi:hypothetical protein